MKTVTMAAAVDEAVTTAVVDDGDELKNDTTVVVDNDK